MHNIYHLIEEVTPPFPNNGSILFTLTTDSHARKMRCCFKSLCPLQPIALLAVVFCHHLIVSVDMTVTHPFFFFFFIGARY